MRERLLAMPIGTAIVVDCMMVSRWGDNCWHFDPNTGDRTLEQAVYFLSDDYDPADDD